MQKLFIIITFLALSASSSLSLDLDISIQEPLGMGQIYSAAKFENKVAVVGSRDIEGSIVKIYDGSTWSEIPIYYEINGLLDSLKLNNFSKVDFDSKGNIWVSGVNYFYKFDGIKWSEYYYDDQYTSYRKNMNFLIDKNDMAWIATSVDNKQGIQKSHLLKYDGKQFEIVFQTNSPVTFYPKNSPNNEMAEMEDGTILCNIKIYRNMDPDLFQGDTTKTLYFFRPDGSIEKKLVPEKYYLKGANPNVKHIFIDSNRIWLSKMTQLFSNFGNPFYCCGGLSLLEDDNWTEFDTTNGLGYSNGVIESVFFYS